MTLQDLQIAYNWVDIKLKRAESAVYMKHSNSLYNINTVKGEEDENEEKLAYKRMIKIKSAIENEMDKAVENFINENQIL